MAKRKNDWRGALDNLDLPTGRDTFGGPKGITLPTNQPQRPPVPDNALIPAEDGTLKADGFTLTSTGLLIDDDTTVEQWESMFPILRRLNHAIQWIIGDYLNHGERVFGVTYRETAGEMDREIKTMYNWALVAQKIDISRRREMLTFSHHEVVASLGPSEQDHWLQQAESHQWSVATLRASVKGTRSGGSDLVDRFANDAAKYQKRFQREAKRAASAPPERRHQIAAILDQHIEEVARLRDALRE